MPCRRSELLWPWKFVELFLIFLLNGFAVLQSGDAWRGFDAEPFEHMISACSAKVLEIEFVFLRSSWAKDILIPTLHGSNMDHYKTS